VPGAVKPSLTGPLVGVAVGTGVPNANCAPATGMNERCGTAALADVQAASARTERRVSASRLADTTKRM
jgi:hypothetical protein